MKRILLAIDFRNEMSGAFDYTIKLAHKLGAEVTLFHAYGDGELMTDEDEVIKHRRTINKIRSFVNNQLDADKWNVPIHYKAERAFPNTAIKKIADAQEFDLVVLGIKRGQYSIDLLLGSKAIELLLDLSCPVLIVPERFRTEEIQRLGCTVDFKFRDIALIKRLRTMGKRLGENSSVHCLHVFERSADEDRIFKDIAILKEIFDRVKSPPVEFDLTIGTLTPEINKYAEMRELDLLAMNTHQKKLLQKWLANDVTASVARAITVPLLVFKNL